jgi:acyl carrier protein
MISSALKGVILDVLRLDDWDIQDETLATEVPGWDSLKHVDVIMAVEKGFGIRFKNTDVLKLKNIGDLQKLVDLKLKEKNLL